MASSNVMSDGPTKLSEHPVTKRAAQFSITFVLILICLAGTSIYVTLAQIKQETKRVVEQGMHSILKGTHTAEHIWAADMKRYIETFSKDKQVITLIQNLSNEARQSKVLATSSALRAVRKMYSQSENLSTLGFFVISPDNITIGAVSDDVLAQTNIISKAYPHLLKRVFAGELVLIPPIDSNFKSTNNASSSKPKTTMFVAAPVINSSGEVFAAITITINPEQSFLRISQLGQVKETHFTYVFDHNGVAFRGSEEGVVSDPELTRRHASHIKSLLDLDHIEPTSSNNPEYLLVSDMVGYKNSRGQRVFGMFLWDHKLGIGFASEIDVTVAMAAYEHTKWITIFLFLLMGIFVVLFCLAILWLIRHNHYLVKNYNENLESEVVARTNELITVNAELDSHRQQLNSIFKSIPNAVLTVDINRKIVHANKHASHLFGYSEDEFNGMVLEQLLPERFRHYHEGIFAHFVKSNSTEILPTRHFLALNKEGEEIAIELSISIYKFDGDWFAVAGVQDIRERIRIEKEKDELKERLFQAQRMETVGQLAGGIAHDFNNLLTSIIGFTELTKQVLPEENSTPHDYLNTVIDSGSKARDLVKQLLSFSRSDRIQKRVIDVNPIIENAMKVLRATISQRIEICTNYKTKHSFILADATQIHQIVMNLVINARDALKGSGRINLRVGDYSGPIDCPACGKSGVGKYLELCVSDNGKGINADDYSKIFEPFYTTKLVGEGTGMGLSIVHGIVHGCNGHLRVESEPNVNTSIYLYFPVREENHTEPSTTQLVEEASASSSSSNKGKTIMIIDDEWTISSFLSELLTSWGYSTLAFNQPRLALEYIQTHTTPPDLIICDQSMPEMSGIELMKDVLDIFPEVPIVLCTGHSDSVGQESALQQGAKAFLYKPLMSSMIQLEVDRWCSGKTTSANN